MSKIGIGVVSVCRPHFFETCINSLPDSDVVVEVINGRENYAKSIDKVIYHPEIHNVARNKNDALKFLVEEAGCDHVFLCEDDIQFTDRTICNKYIEVSEITGIQHLNYGGHGSYNRNPMTGEIAVKKIVDYGNTKIDIYHNILGAWSYYHRSCITSVGYMNEQYNNAMEHVDHTFRIIKNNLHPPFWWFADIHQSHLFIKDIKPNFQGSQIRKSPDWHKNLTDACLLFEKNNMYQPMAVPDVGETAVISSLKEIVKCKN